MSDPTRFGPAPTTRRSRGCGGRGVLVLLSAEEHHRLAEWGRITGGRSLAVVLRDAALREVCKSDP